MRKNKKFKIDDDFESKPLTKEEENRILHGDKQEREKRAREILESRYEQETPRIWWAFIIFILYFLLSLLISRK